MTNLNTDNQNFKLTNKDKKEVLEISPTGYGLESVVIDANNSDTKAEQNMTSSTCGGL
nr:hypothetical protein [Neobacillus sp. Marseille-Q6967]